MDPLQEARDIFHRGLTKLQTLSQADGLEIAGFTVLLFFLGIWIILMAIACSACCAGAAAQGKKQAKRVEPA